MARSPPLRADKWTTTAVIAAPGLLIHSCAPVVDIPVIDTDTSISVTVRSPAVLATRRTSLVSIILMTTLVTEALLPSLRPNGASRKAIFLVVRAL